MSFNNKWLWAAMILIQVVYRGSCSTDQARKGVTGNEYKSWGCDTFGTSPNKDNVFFYLYTRKNPNSPQRLVLGQRETIENSNLDPNAHTVFYAHGFTDWADGEGSQAIKNEYVKNKDLYNVILIDWCELAKPFRAGLNVTEAPEQYGWCTAARGIICPNSENANEVNTIFYYTAACNVLTVGEYVADMAKFLVSLGFADLNRMHLIGHSLGAHLSGVAGHHIRQNNPRPVARITGLDPALPLFSDRDLPLSQRLDPTDAEFVDVIHTAGSEESSSIPICISLGFLQPLGHIDFYPNEGRPPQPGCGLYTTCSHSRAYHLYAESINNPNAFPSCPCVGTDYAQCEAVATCAHPNYMGLYATQIKSNPTQRWYHLQTNDNAPYGKGGCPMSISLAPAAKYSNTSEIDAQHVVSIGPGRYGVMTAFNLIEQNRKFPLVSMSYMDRINSPVHVTAKRNFKLHQTSCNPPPAQTNCLKSQSDYKTSSMQETTYGHTAFHKGHLTPLRPFMFDPSGQTMDTTCLCTNIAPQDPFTNMGPWCSVEEKVFNKAIVGSGYVLTGTCQNEWDQTFTGAAVPNCWWKVFCYKQNNKVVAVGFYADNSMVKKNDDYDKAARKDSVRVAFSQNELFIKLGESQIISDAWEYLERQEINDRLFQGHVSALETDPPTPTDCAAAVVLDADDRALWQDQFIRTNEDDTACRYCLPGEDCTVDDTIEICGSGRDLVFTVVRKIFNSALFEPDYQYLYRLANVLTNFGLADGTCAYYGGIWKIEEGWFDETRAQISPQLRADIMSKFDIDWTETKWEDLRKPMYSGLAARILMQVRNIPMHPTIQGQGDTIFSAFYNQPASDFVHKTHLYYEEDKARGRYDMITILDGSGSIGSAEFQKAKEGVAGLLSPFAENQVRIGLVLFSTNAENIISLNNEMTGQEINNRILSMTYSGGGTNTEKGIRNSIDMYRVNQLDPKVPSVNLVLTDGQSNNPAETIIASNEAKAEGIYTFAVGIGSNPTYSELLKIAGDNPRHVFQLKTADPFAALKEIPLWLNIETQTIPLIRPENDTFQDTVGDGERRYFKYPLSEEGLTIEVYPTSGETRTFYSYSFDAPSSAIHDGEIVDGLTFIPNRQASTRALYTSLYVSVEGLEDDSKFEIDSHTGFFEGCGFVGDKRTQFELPPIFETAAVNTVLFSQQLYTGPMSFSSLDRNYLNQVVDGSAFEITTKARFADFVTERREILMTSSVSFSCGDGSMREYEFIIPIIDENNQKPKINASSTHFSVSLPVALDLPINNHFHLISIDDDYEEENARLFASTNDTLVVAHSEKSWSTPHPARYEYSLNLYFTEQPAVGVHNILVHVHDGMFQDEVTVSIEVA